MEFRTEKTDKKFILHVQPFYIEIVYAVFHRGRKGGGAGPGPGVQKIIF